MHSCRRLRISILTALIASFCGSGVAIADSASDVSAFSGEVVVPSAGNDRSEVTAQFEPKQKNRKPITDLATVRVDAYPSQAHARRASVPGAVGIVDSSEFATRTINNVADALQHIPGVWASSATGGSGTFLSIRGSNLDAIGYDGSGVVLLQDGLPVTTADGNNHNRIPDPRATRRMVVARGANALSWGASSLGGAINFVSLTARNSAARQVLMGIGSDGQYRGRVRLGAVSGNWDGLLDLGSSHRDGYREHSAERQHSVRANVGWQASERFALRLFASHVDNRQELAGALSRQQLDSDRWQANASAIHGDHQRNVRTSRLAAKARWDLDADSRLEVGVSWEEQALYHPVVDVLVDKDGPGPSQPVNVFSLLIDTDQRTIGSTVRYQLKTGAHDMVAGLTLAETDNVGGNYENRQGYRGPLKERVSNSAWRANLYWLDRWSFATDWTLVYGAQMLRTGRQLGITDMASGQVRQPAQVYSALNPRLGLIRNFGPHAQAYASASRIFEAPTLYDLSNDIAGSDHSLDAMHGIVYELGLRGRQPEATDRAAWYWDASVYYTALRDEILSVDDPDAPGTSLTTNIDRTRHAGLEALLGVRIPLAGGASRLEPEVSVTWNAFSFDKDRTYGDNELPAAPQYMLHGQLLYRHHNGFFIGPTVSFIGSRWVDFANHYKVDAFQLLGFRAGFAQDNWQFHVQARNLTNEDYLSTLSVRNHAQIGDAVLQPGAPRSFYAGVRWLF